jgi:hypothetical protein
MASGLHHLVQLEPVALRPALELEGPAAAVEALGSAGILDHPVQRYELGYDDAPHCHSLGRDHGVIR